MINQAETQIINTQINDDIISSECFEMFIRKNKTEMLPKIEGVSWNHYQTTLSNIITKEFQSFKVTKSCSDKTSFIPSAGVKGVYFCLGDDGYSLSISGSLYVNESDWAANAEFYPQAVEYPDKIFHHISKELISHNINETDITYILFLFTLFTICKVMPKLENIPEVKNALIVLGYSDGDEFILGKFTESKFELNINVNPDGAYEHPSTAISLPVKTIIRGEYYDYLKHNYMPLIRANGLAEQLYNGGEVEAINIFNQLKDHLFINICSRCGSLKKTPRARLCLTCHDFT